MMTTSKTTYIGHFTQESYRRGDELTRTVEADSIDELVTYGTDNRMTYCDIQERETVTMNANDKSFHSDPAPVPGRLYFNVREILSRDEMIARSEKALDDLPKEVKDMMRQAERMDPGFRQMFDQLADEGMADMKRLPADTCFAHTDANKQFELKKDDAAYDAQGKKLWPAPKRNALAPAAPKAKGDDTKAGTLSRVRKRNRYKL